MAKSMIRVIGSLAVVLSALLTATPGTGGTQERSVSTLTLAKPRGLPRIEVSATQRIIRFEGFDGVDYVVQGIANLRVARIWADSAEKLLASTLGSRVGEVHRHEVAAHRGLSLIREVDGQRSKLGLWLADQYAVNTVLFDLTPAEARSLIGAVRRAAEHLARFRNEQEFQPFPYPYDEATVAVPVELVSGRLPSGLRFGASLDQNTGTAATFVVLPDGQVDRGSVSVTVKYELPTPDRPEEIEQEVREFIQSARFTPARLSGRPVAQRVVLHLVRK